MTSSVVEYENLLSTSFSDANTSRPTSGVLPRWKRKQLELSASQDENGKSSMLSSSSTLVVTKESSSPQSETRHPLGNANSRLSNNTTGNNGDRFIPNRAAMDIEKSALSLRSSDSSSLDGEVQGDTEAAVTEGSTVSSTDKDEYKSALSSSILGVEESASHRILSFKEKAPAPKGDTVNNLTVLYSSHASGKTNPTAKLVARQIPTAPSRILDAPDLLDDYYLNLLSWSDTNILAVALSQTVYLWNASSGNIQELCTFEGSGPDSYISSVSWVQEGGAHLAVGTSAGTTQLWDVQAERQLRSMDGHSDRVGALSWNRHIISSGGRDSIIMNHDVRIAKHNVGTLVGHSQEVCGLSWSPDGMVLASGANDNTLRLWDCTTLSNSTPRYTLTDHQAAVKALAWSPHERNLLASGGGTADRTIKFWNTQTGALLNSIETGSQVCALQWNPHEKEILSSHGFARNQLSLWKYPMMSKIKDLEGHTSRVIHLATSPDGCSVVSAAADETLRFWDVFAIPGKTAGKRAASDSTVNFKNKKLSKTMHIR